MRIVIFTVSLLHFLSGVYSLESNFEQNDLDYDMQKLSVDWSPSNTCKNFFNNDTETTCSSCKSPKAINKWTIHGLWPSSRYGADPFNCSDIPFDAKLLSDELISEMRSKWPNVWGWTNEEFWIHEWTKHGTCSYRTEDTDTMPKYFSKTVELYDHYNIRKILDDAGIVPNNNYRTEDIQQTLKNSLGVKVFMACVLNQQFQQQFLLEIHICFDKSLSLVDCEDTNKYLNSCTRDYEITYVESC